MKKIVLLLMLTFFLTGCDISLSQEINQEQLDVIKREVYNDLKNSIENDQIEQIKSEIYNELKAKIESEQLINHTNLNELKENLDNQKLEYETLITDINHKINEMVKSNLNNEQLTNDDLELMRQEFNRYIDALINSLSIDLKQNIIHELSTNLEASDDLESLLFNVVNTNTKAVLGVSNYQMVNLKLVESSTGSGVIYKKENNDYYLVTNEHVVRDAKKLKVVLEDRYYIDAILVGSDLHTDLAVLKFTTTIPLPVSTFANSDFLQRGQIVVAMGSPYGYDLYGTVTTGVISGLARNVAVDYNDDGTVDFTETLIQHDAAINPGNSGGPLYNLNGEIIGINNMKSIEEYVDNIGFAIPSNTVMKIISILESNY